MQESDGRNRKTAEQKAEDVCLPAGSVLQGRYEIEAVLEERSTDILYSAQDRQLNRRVRIQEYFPHRRNVRRVKTGLQTEEDGRERFRKGMERFCKNGRTLAGFAAEEDIVRVFSGFTGNNTAYLVTEERECMTLADALKQGPFPEAEALEILEAACNALDKCHEAGLCHGQLGPDSFWLLGNRQEGEYGLVLKDFGLGKPEGELTAAEKDVCDLARLYVRLILGAPDTASSGSGRGRQIPDGELPPAVVRALEHEIRTTGDFLRALTGQTEEKRERRAGAVWAEQKKAELSAFRMSWVIRAVVVCVVFFAVFGIWTAAEHGKTARQKELAAEETKAQPETAEQTETEVFAESSAVTEMLSAYSETETSAAGPTEPNGTLPQEGQAASEETEEAAAAAPLRTQQERRTAARTRAAREKTAQTRAAQPSTAAETTIAPRPENGDSRENATIAEGSVARAEAGGIAPGAAAQAQTQAPQKLPTAQEQQIQLVEPSAGN